MTPELPSPAADDQPSQEPDPVTTREERAVKDTKDSLRVSQDGVAEPTSTPRSTRAGRGRARRIKVDPRLKESRKRG
ncbi:hypothetical protein EV643_115179 [Kribbella sp. VKM Ac-2527]|uniref:Uncharacterized protein n=1 Tax=Kribbella caucasensis TaxID=2512215 RepID=A0A4R6K5S2_9ACTN|nr:hypothetical protein [Kribbella sp. VKM Ac-2527]TDO44677.1 hypothetical protein EV643_115179 [Kribbella sp. VKM Ac-2527]